MKIIAGTGCPVICSIHQPSSEIFYLFDIAIFMKSGESVIMMMMIIIVIVIVIVMIVIIFYLQLYIITLLSLS